jgi:hypothetical protein
MLEVRRFLFQYLIFFCELDIYGIWFISKNDCPRVTECLKQSVSISKNRNFYLYFSLTINAKESEQSKQIPFNNNGDIFSLLTNAQEKFQESVCLKFFFFLLSIFFH